MVRVKIFWGIQNNKPVIDSINKLNSHKKAKQESNFDFSTQHIKKPQNKLFAPKNSIIEFAFRGDTRDNICMLNNEAYRIKITAR